MAHIVVTPGSGGLAAVAISALGTEHVCVGQMHEPVTLVQVCDDLIQTAIDMVCSEAAKPELLTFRVDGREVLPTWKKELLGATADYAALAPTEIVRCPFGCGKDITATDAHAHGNFGCRR